MWFMGDGTSGTWLGVGGIASYLGVRSLVFAQVVSDDPGSLTDAAGGGGVAITVAGAVISGFQVAKHLVPMILDERRAAREERTAARAKETQDAILTHRVDDVERHVEALSLKLVGIFPPEAP